MIKRIKLTSFRNHRNLSLEFNKRFVYISGINGSGKTSVLEAINYISNAKSHRTNNDLDVIEENMRFSKIILETEKDKYQLVLSEEGKIAAINNKEIIKISLFIGNLKTVMFSPEDLNLVKGNPGIRRMFLDLELIKIDKEYLNNLSMYRKLLKERNALLKTLTINSDYRFLDIISDNLYKVALEVIKQRKIFLDKLNQEFIRIYKNFSNNKVSLEYTESLDGDELYSHLFKNQKQDILYKTTVNGPHRDDFKIIFNDKNAKNASQGEIRLVVISIKLALVRIIKEIKQDDVILLLDDVLSELDSNIQNMFLKELPSDIQVIMNSAIEIKNEKIQIINLKEKNHE